MGDNKGLIPQIFRADGFFHSQRRIPSHQDTPCIFHWKGDPFIFLRIRLCKEQTEINKALVQIFKHMFCIAAGYVIPYIRIFPLYSLCNFCEQADYFSFTASYEHIAGDDFIRTGYFFFCPMQEKEHFFCAFAEDHSFLG